MAKILKRVRKPSEKAASTQATAAKTHKKDMKVKLDVGGRKPIPTSKLVASKKPPKSKAAKSKALAAPPIEVSSDSEKDKNKKKKKKKKEKDGEKKKDDDDVEGTNAPLIAKKLFDQKDRRITDFKRRVNDVKEDHVDVSSTSNFEKDEVIPSANKKDVDEILTLITKTYTFVWMTYFDNVQFDEDDDFSHTVINVRKLKFKTLHLQVEESANTHASKRELTCHTRYFEAVMIWNGQKADQKIISKLKTDMKYRGKMIEQLKMCFLNKLEKKSVYVRIALRFNRIIIDVLSEHLETSFASENIFSIIVMKVKMMQSKMKAEATAKKKKVDKDERIKKKIIAKHTCTDVKCFKYSESVCYTEARKNWHWNLTENNINN